MLPQHNKMIRKQSPIRIVRLSAVNKAPQEATGAGKGLEEAATASLGTERGSAGGAHRDGRTSLW